MEEKSRARIIWKPDPDLGPERKPDLDSQPITVTNWMHYKCESSFRYCVLKFKNGSILMLQYQTYQLQYILLVFFFPFFSFDNSNIMTCPSLPFLRFFCLSFERVSNRFYCVEFLIANFLKIGAVPSVMRL